MVRRKMRVSVGSRTQVVKPASSPEWEECSYERLGHEWIKEQQMR
jgi:hypothetical protein